MFLQHSPRYQGPLKSFLPGNRTGFHRSLLNQPVHLKHRLTFSPVRYPRLIPQQQAVPMQFLVVSRDLGQIPRQQVDRKRLAAIRELSPLGILR